MVPAPEGRQTMAHTFANLLTPVIFSTKDRQPLLPPHLRTDLLAYLGGIVRNIHGKLMDSNARPDHVHCLLSLPPALAVAQGLRLIKSNSSLGPPDLASGGLRLAGGVRRLQRQPIQRTRGGEVYSRPRAAPPHDFLSRGIPRLPEGASDPLRRAVYLGAASAAPAGGCACGGCPRPHGSRRGLFSIGPPGLTNTKPQLLSKGTQC